MKLLNCLKCHFIGSLSVGQTTTCHCKASQARYKRDGIYAIVCGKDARILGMLNEEYKTSIHATIVPFETNYKWFPILSQDIHHVMHFDNESGFLKQIKSDQPHRAQCLVCKSIIESTSNHHFVTCKCGALSLDGGQGGRILCQARNDFLCLDENNQPI